MGTKKDIGRAIKERMADYKPYPDPKLWQNVKLNLQLKQRKRVLYRWISFSGLLLLIIGISLILFTTNYFETPTSHEIALPETENIDSNNTNSNETKNDLNVTTNSTQKEVKESANSNKPAAKSNEADVNLDVQNNNSVNGTPAEGNKVVNNKASAVTKAYSGSNKTLNNTSSKKVSNTSEQQGKKRNVEKNSGTALAYSNNENQSANPSNQENTVNERKGTETNSENNLVESEDNPEYNFSKNTTDSITSSLTEAINLKKSDSLKQVKEKEEEIEKLLMLRKKDSLEKAERVYSVTLFSGISAGDLQSSDSSIDPVLNNNDTKQKTKLNYGATVNFYSNLRFSIRTGILYQRYQTIVNDVDPFTSLRYVNIKPGVDAINSFFNSGSNFSIEQEYSYILIPLEIRYDLLKDSSLLGLVGSANFSILRDNKVDLLNGNNNSLELGTSSLAENEISLGGGLSSRPKLTDRLYLNIEGLFYYQPFRYNDKSFGSDIEFQFRLGLEYKLKL